MFSLKDCNIYDVTKPLHFFSGLLGFSPFSIKKVNQNFMQHTNSLNIFCILFSTFNNLALTYVYHFYIHGNSKKTSEVFQTSIHIIVVVFSVITVFINWWSFLARKYYLSILNIFSEIDSEFCKVKVNVNFKKHKKVMLSLIMLTKVLSGTISALLQEHNEIEGVLFYVSIYSCFAYFELNLLATCQYLYWIWAVKLRYCKINMFLGEHFFSTPVQTIESGGNKLNVSCNLHEKLVDASEAINKYYGLPVTLEENFIKYFAEITDISLQIMVITANNFCCTTLCLFNAMNLGFPRNLQAFTLWIATVLAALIQGGLIYCTSHMGHFARREVTYLICFKMFTLK